MKVKVSKKVSMIISLITGLAMIYARWQGLSNLVVDIWNTMFICSVSYSEINGGDKKFQNHFYRMWVIAIGVMLTIYILVTIL
jgi:hypothetical protein